MRRGLLWPEHNVPYSVNHPATSFWATPCLLSWPQRHSPMESVSAYTRMIHELNPHSEERGSPKNNNNKRKNYIYIYIYIYDITLAAYPGGTE